jgi:hypothetical protein
MDDLAEEFRAGATDKRLAALARQACGIDPERARKSMRDRAEPPRKPHGCPPAKRGVRSKRS